MTDAFTKTTLNYPQGADTPIKRVKVSRAPLTTDYKNFILGDEWLDTSSDDWWKLVDVAQQVATWVRIGGVPGDIATLTGNTGGAVGPDASHNVNILGTSGQITVTGNSATNTLTLALAGGGTAVDSIAVDASSAPGTNPVAPTAAGQITITGAQVATGTVGANVVRTDSLAANTLTIEIQRCTAVASTASANNGVCHFNSGQFSVDANGFVGARGGSLVWSVIGASQTLVINNGYICGSGAALALALPAASAVGDMIEVTLDGSTSWTITQGAGQQIRVGNVTSTLGAGGSVASTAQGDSIRIVCRTANTLWQAVGGTIGALSIT